MAPGLGGSPKLLEGSLRLPAGPLHPLSDDGLPPAGSRSGWAVRLLVTGARGRSTTTASIDSSTAVGLVVISSITVRAFSAIAKIGRFEMNPWRRETGSNRRCQVSHIRPGVPPTSIGDRLELTTVRPWPPMTIASRRVWRCRFRHSRQQFANKIGTILENSPLWFDKWLPAIWLITSAKSGISSYELHRCLKRRRPRRQVLAPGNPRRGIPRRIRGFYDFLGRTQPMIPAGPRSIFTRHFRDFSTS